MNDVDEAKAIRNQTSRASITALSSATLGRFYDQVLRNRNNDNRPTSTETKSSFSTSPFPHCCSDLK